VAGQHPRLVRQGQEAGGQRGQHLGGRPAGQVGAADRAGEHQVPGQQPARLVAVGRRPEGDVPGGVAGGVVDGQAQAGQLDHLAVGQLADVVGLLQGEPGEGGPGVGAEPGQGVGEQVPVGRVDEGRDAVGAGQGGHGPDVVEVAVGQQRRHRLEAVAPAQLPDPGQGVLAGVDDQGLRARRGGDQPAVGLEGPGGKSGHEHGPHATGTAPVATSGYR
jgi:hypothetical protein